MIAQNRLNGSKYLSYNNRRSNQKLQRFKLVSLMTIAEETASYICNTHGHFGLSACYDLKLLCTYLS